MEYLDRIRHLDVIIEQKKQEAAGLRDVATAIGAIGYSADKVRTSPSPEAPYAKTVEKLTELDTEIRALEDERHAIISSIQALDDRRCMEVLYRRYVSGERFEDIAREMGYSIQHIFRLYHVGLEKMRVNESRFKDLT